MSFTATRSKMTAFSGAPTADYQLQSMAKEVRDILNELYPNHTFSKINIFII